jgi:general secretion pathway protein N
MKRAWIWIAAALLVTLLTVLLSLPAGWLVPLVERQTDGRVSIGDPEGSVWQGSGFLGAASSSEEPLVALLPGRFQWTLSPLALIGIIDASLRNDTALSRPVTIHGSWSHWDLGAGSINLPAERLTALGAPLNTVQPSGLMTLSWPGLTITRTNGAVQVEGRMQLDMTQIASALSPVKPLGAYRMHVDWQGSTARINLKSLSGPLLLEGAGEIVNGRLRFSGQAWAQEGEEQRLAILLNLLGQRRRVGNRNVIALEFQ